MKVGILTFHRALNYGAVLQCYALQGVLRSMGQDVRVIDYTPKAILKDRMLFYWRRSVTKYILKLPYYFFVELFSIPFRKKRIENFDKFLLKKIRIDSPNNIDEFDTIIVGSDQVWNVKMLGGWDAYYWKRINTKGNWISYAASIGDKINDEVSYKIASYLNGFNHVSVREKSAKDYLDSLNVPNVSQVLDPTLLVNSEFWLEESNDLREDNYILVYLTITNKVASNLALELSNKTGWRIVEVKAKSSWSFRNNEYQCAGPDMFLDLFRNAKYVITTSFHGTAFSIIYKRPFSVVRDGNGRKNVRSEDLLGLLGLEQRIYIAGENNDTSDNIDWQSVQNNLDSLRNKSLNYLEKSIEA